MATPGSEICSTTGPIATYSLDAWEAGSRAWNRWAADAFGFALDRFLVTAAVGPCVDIAAAARRRSTG